MHNLDNKHPTQRVFEPSISDSRATTELNEPSGPDTDMVNPIRKKQGFNMSTCDTVKLYHEPAAV